MTSLITLAQTTMPSSDIPPYIQSAPWYVQLLYAVAMGAITLMMPFLLSWIRSQIKLTKSADDKNQLERISMLRNQVQSFLNTNATTIAERDIPRIAELIDKGVLKNEDDIKVAVRRLGETLRGKAINYFENQGVDIMDELTGEHLDVMIRRAADEASPFPGMITSAALLNPALRKSLIENGVESTRYDVVLGKYPKAKEESV